MGQGAQGPAANTGSHRGKWGTPPLLGSDPPWQVGTGSRWPRGLYSRSVPVHLDGVDTVLGPAPTLKERTVVLELQTLAREVAALEDF